MTWSKPLSEIELAYIEKSWPRLSCAEIAEKLGRSKRGVENAVSRMGLREPRAPAGETARARADDEDAKDDERDELAELLMLKRAQKRQIREAGPQSLPRLSAEFRETVKRIDELRNGGKGNDGSRGAMAGKQAQPESLVVSIPLRPA